VTAALERFHAPVRSWFERTLGTPTTVQERGWQAIADGQSVLLLAPTGSGKTLAAFLSALDRLMFQPASGSGVRVVYVSPLKALGIDVERNLRGPIAGILESANGAGSSARVPSVLVRSGDTPASERARFRRHPTEILITTPESLYLLLTSGAAAHLATVDTLILDEIHTLVGSKRGAHLALSVERLERLRPSDAPPLQRIGLSATVRPIEETAAYLGGARVVGDAVERRPVTVIDAGAAPKLKLRIEVPIEDMALAIESAEERSIWPSLHGPLLELIRSHRSTLLFVNSRRLAERLSAALNESAGETLTFAHHGSVAKERRAEIEEALKAGRLRALVATSSLELGIDMGAIDLVVQIGAPPSVASGLQRVGRSGHAVGGTSSGVIIPKFRGELLAAAATAERMREARVEASQSPKNPLDVLAQQLVAIAASEPIGEDELYALVRAARPFETLPREAFESVLDLLSGRYPSADFAELKPRLVWDRIARRITARQGARHVAIVNGGTIPDRGLFGVFLANAPEGKSIRVGELDEEMVYESRVGEVFLLGASSWRIVDITFDRVLVTPAPGEPGRMPFWKGEQSGRPLELGQAIGQLSRELCSMPEAEASARLEAIGLDPRAARNLRQYLAEQLEASGHVPSDRELVVEQFPDEVGDFRLCLLSPFGARVHAPWALACMELHRRVLRIESDAVWSDDGIVFRFPEATPLEDLALLVPDADALDELLLEGLGKSSLFSARFRENAARALLLPRKRPGQRTPLWAQRRRAADLLRAASAHPDFPIVLETYRECLSDVFDVPGLRELLRAIGRREIRVNRSDRRAPSPFAATLLFSYVGNFMYEGDAPLAERRAQALTVDPEKLRKLLGEAELRRLLDPAAIESVAREAAFSGRLLEHPDAVHDLLLGQGDRSLAELEAQSPDPAALSRWLEELLSARRLLLLEIGGEARYIAAEDAARFRDALGIALPDGLPAAFLTPVAAPLADLVSRYARTHGPFQPAALVERYGLPEPVVVSELERQVESGRLTRGAFMARGAGVEYCDSALLGRIRQRSLQKLRREVEPVAPRALVRFTLGWQGVAPPRRGAGALAAALQQLEGAPLVASALESEILRARVEGYERSELDALTSSGEVVWRGLDSLGSNDGRIALYRSDRYARLAPPALAVEGELAERLREQLRKSGASFFTELVARTRAFPRDALVTLWNMVWAGELTNDTLAPLRSRLAEEKRKGRPGRAPAGRVVLPGSEGRWSLLERWLPDPPDSDTERAALRVEVLLERYGVLTREALASDGLGSFSELYPVLRALEEAGRIRRGYFAGELGAAQFARPNAEDRLRRSRDEAQPGGAVVLAATDPANPFGAVLPWPDGPQRPQRAAGALVIVWDGLLLGFLPRGEKGLLTFLDQAPSERAPAEAALATALVAQVDGVRRRALVLGTIDGEPAARSRFGSALAAAGFTRVGDGYVLRRSAGLGRGSAGR
jgi:ATP-dependent Lhr-like helicase